MDDTTMRSSSSSEKEGSGGDSSSNMMMRRNLERSSGIGKTRSLSFDHDKPPTIPDPNKKSLHQKTASGFGGAVLSAIAQKRMELTEKPRRVSDGGSMDDDTMMQSSTTTRLSWGGYSMDGIATTRNRQKRGGAAGIGDAVLSAITKKRIELAEKKKTEINVLCSDLVVSTKFTLGRLKFVQDTPSVVSVELEDLIERQDQTLFLNAKELITCDKRPWKSVAFMDHLYSEDRLDRYLNLKKDLWRLIEADVIKRKIPIKFQAVVDINRGTTIQSVIASFRSLSEAEHLHSVEFDGAIFGFVPWDVPKELLRLCRNGYLRETISLKVLFQRSDDDDHAKGEGGQTDSNKDHNNNNSKVKIKRTKSWENNQQEGETETAAIGQQRSVRVLGACIVRLQRLAEHNTNNQNNSKDGEKDDNKATKAQETAESGEGDTTATDNKNRSNSLPTPPDKNSLSPTKKKGQSDGMDGSSEDDDDENESSPLRRKDKRSASTGDLQSIMALSPGGGGGGGEATTKNNQAHQRWMAARPVINRMSSRKKLIAMRKGLQRMINEKCEQALWERELNIDEVDDDDDDDDDKPRKPRRTSSFDHSRRKQQRGSITGQGQAAMAAAAAGRRPIKRSTSMEDDSFSSLLHSNLGRSSRWRPDQIHSMNNRRALTPPPSSGRTRLRRSNTMEKDESLSNAGSRRHSGGLRTNNNPAAGRRSLLLTGSGPLTPPRAAASKTRIIKRLDESFSSQMSASRGGRRRLPRRSFTMDDNSITCVQNELKYILPSLRSSTTKDAGAGKSKSATGKHFETEIFTPSKESDDDSSSSSSKDDDSDNESSAPSVTDLDLAEGDKPKKKSKKKQKKKKAAQLRRSCPNLHALANNALESSSTHSNGSGSGKKAKKKKKGKMIRSKSAHASLKDLVTPKKTKVTRSKSAHTPMRGSLAPHQFFSDSMSATEITEFYLNFPRDDSDTDTDDDEDEFALPHAHERPSFNWETSQQNFDWKLYAMVADS